MKKILIPFLAIVFLGLSQAQAAPSCAELNRLWQNEYFDHFKVKMPGWKYTEFSCGTNQGKMAKTFYYIGEIQENFNQRGQQIDFYGWCNLFPSGSKYQDQIDGTDDHIMATVNHETIYFTRAFVQRINEPLVMAATYIHEVRHTRDDDIDHQTCERGRFKGSSDSCDNFEENNLFLSGAHNSEFGYVKWFMDFSRASDLSRSFGKRYMSYLIHNRFNKVSNRQIRKYSNYR